MLRIKKTQFTRPSACPGVVVLMILGCLVGDVAFPAATALGGSSSLDATAAAFKPYILGQVGTCLVATKTLRDRIASGDLAGAQQAWLAARAGWESSEIVAAELFPDLDRAIDAWPDARVGFHAIEARLFGAHSVDALGAADDLLRNLTDFERQLRTTTLSAQDLLNGTTRLLYEIGEDKAGGGESPFSGNSLAEVASNVTAIAAAYQRIFAPSVQRKNAVLGATVSADLARLRQLVSVPSLKQLDPARLRDLTESLTSNFMVAGEILGLKPPELGN